MNHRREAILAALLIGTLLLAVVPAAAAGGADGSDHSGRLEIDPHTLDVMTFGDADAELEPVLGHASAATSGVRSSSRAREYVHDEVLVAFHEGGNALAGAGGGVHARVGGTVDERVTGGAEFEVVSLPSDMSVEEAVLAYEAQPEVALAQPNYVYSLAVEPDDTMFGWQYGLANIGQTDGDADADIDAPDAWEYLTGSAEVTVAVIDSGVDLAHPDLAPNLVAGWDFVDGDGVPEPNHWHGSHVAGTIGASGNDGRGVSGVCWDVSVMPLKAFDNTGNATSANLAAAITYAGANGADVINASWGGYGAEDVMVKAAITGVPDALFVAAAGNGDDTPGDTVGDDIDATPYYPACYDLPNVLAVAATDDTDALASFSNYGATSVDVAAPGVQVLSAAPSDISWFYQFRDDFPLATAGGWSTDQYIFNPWATTDVRSDTAPRSMAHRLYVGDEESYLDLRYPLDLSHATSATAFFEVYADLEGGADWLVPIASTTGDAGDWNVVGGAAWSGSTGGSFRTTSLSLEEYLGETTVYLAFVFVSDSDDEYEGIYIDNFDVLVKGGYALSNGTSMATPHAAGVAALLRSASPAMTVAEMKSYIIATCDAKPGLAGKVVSGGRINAANAIGAVAASSDSVAPTTTDDAPVGWSSAPVTVTLDATDAAGSGEVTSGVAATHYWIDAGAPATYTAPIAVSAEGTTTLGYRSVDYADNTEATKTATLLIDSTPPTTTSDAVASYEDSATITLAATDAYSGVDATFYRLDGSAPITYTIPIAVSDYGDHTLEFYSRDALGNTEATSSFGFAIGYSDTLAPTTTDDAPAAWGSSPVYVRLSATDAAQPGEHISGVATTMYELDGASAAPYTAPIKISAEGGHEIRYWSVDGAGNAETPRSTGFFVTQQRVERVAAATRFSTAVQIAREGFAGGGSDWAGVTHIVIASGDDRAAADPLAAAGLCWAYDAPLFLVSAGFTPAEVIGAVREIAADNPGTRVQVHIVGGPVSVPDARYNDIARAVGSSRLAKDRLLASGGRFEMAAKIAREMERVSGDTPDTVLVANGADSTKFFDALALSPIAAANGYPVLLVSEGSVPGATRSVIGSFDPSTVIVGGGPATVSESVRRSLGGTRWSGADRYSTATTIASRAISSGMLEAETVGVAAKLPDALTGGSMVGAQGGGPLVITNGGSLSAVTGSWLGARKASIAKCYVFGGEKSMTPRVKSQIEARLR